MAHAKNRARMGAIILAGGHGRRLGRRDKAFVRLGGRPLIEHVLDRVTAGRPDIVIVSNNPERYRGYGVLSVADLIPGAGPLGGIYTGLHHASRDKNLIVGCDMPFLQRALLEYLDLHIEERQALIPRTGKLIEPLCAVYRRSCIPVIEQHLASGSRKIGDMLRTVDCAYVDEARLRSLDPSLQSFFNINHHGDLQRAEELISIVRENAISPDPSIY